MHAGHPVRFCSSFVCALIIAWLLLATETKPDDADKAATPAKDPMQGKAAGDVRSDNGLKMKLVWCPPGAFTMGPGGNVGEPVAAEGDAAKTKEQKVAPVKVLLTRGYWLGKFEVTHSQWKQVMQTEPWTGQPFVKDGDNYAATNVSWDDAMEFCRKLTKIEREAGRLPRDWEFTLPTEAQWERACRARTETAYSFGDDEAKLQEYAWFIRSVGGDLFVHEVGLKKPNPWGLHDMHGNVDELCRDRYAVALPGGRDPEIAEGTERVYRGGDFYSDATRCRSGSRMAGQTAAKAVPPNFGAFFLGFRVAILQPRAGK